MTATEARVDIEDVMALSPLQQGLFSLAKLTSGEGGADDPYVIAMAADITARSTRTCCAVARQRCWRAIPTCGRVLCAAT